MSKKKDPLKLGPDRKALTQMRLRGGTWACYQNAELGHRDLGHQKFLKVGEDCTFKTPPDRYPDTQFGIGWRYVYKGIVDLKTGEVTK